MMAICIAVGLVFSFGPGYLFSAVSDENVMRLEGVFSSYEEDYYGEGIAAAVHLADGKTYLIDDDYFSDELTRKLNALCEGMPVQMDIQNDMGYIIGLKTEEDTLIDHDETMRRIEKSKTLARCISYASYGVAALSLVSVVFPKGIKKRRAVRNR